MSVAVSDTGDAAATIAAKADRLFRCRDRRAPRLHVRVASATDVCREGGEEAVIRADADLRDFADQAW